MAAFDKFVDHLRKQHKPLSERGSRLFSPDYRWGHLWDSRPAAMEDVLCQASTSSGWTYFDLATIMTDVREYYEACAREVFDGQNLVAWLPVIYAYKSLPADTDRVDFDSSAAFRSTKTIEHPSFIWCSDPVTKGLSGKWMPVTPKDTSNIFITSLVYGAMNKFRLCMYNVSTPSNMIFETFFSPTGGAQGLIDQCAKYYSGIGNH